MQDFFHAGATRFERVRTSFVRLRVISWIECLGTAREPRNHTNNREIRSGLKWLNTSASAQFLRSKPSESVRS
jgi:hypothetical protein